MSFKITITNNDNGEVLLNEENAVAIIGAVTSEERTAEIGFVNCQTRFLLPALEGAQNAIDDAIGKDKRLEVALSLKKMLEAFKTKNEDKGESKDE